MEDGKLSCQLLSNWLLLGFTQTILYITWSEKKELTVCLVRCSHLVERRLQFLQLGTGHQILWHRAHTSGDERKAAKEEILWLLSNLYIDRFEKPQKSRVCEKRTRDESTYNLRMPESLSERFHGASSGSCGRGPWTGKSSKFSSAVSSWASSHSILKRKKKFCMLDYVPLQVNLYSRVFSSFFGMIGTITIRCGNCGC